MHFFFLSSRNIFPPRLRQKKATATSFHWNCTWGWSKKIKILHSTNFAEVLGWTHALASFYRRRTKQLFVNDWSFSGRAGGNYFCNWKQSICLDWRVASNGSCWRVSFKTLLTLIGSKHVKNNGSEEISASWVVAHQTRSYSTRPSLKKKEGKFFPFHYCVPSHKKKTLWMIQLFFSLKRKGKKNTFHHSAFWLSHSLIKKHFSTCKFFGFLNVKKKL